jgi:hypothetical protein
MTTLRAQIMALEPPKDAGLFTMKGWTQCRDAVLALLGGEEPPLTASVLADALGCFWNAALGAAHEQQEGHAVAAILVEGVAAVQQRLVESAEAASPRATLGETP